MSSSNPSRGRPLNADAILAGALDDVGDLSLLDDLPSDMPPAPDASDLADIGLSNGA